MRIEKGLATLTQNHESFVRIIETKFHDLDVKVTETNRLWRDSRKSLKQGVIDQPHMLFSKCQGHKGL